MDYSWDTVYGVTNSATLESSLGPRLLSALDESDAEGPYELYWRNPGCEWDWS